MLFIYDRPVNGMVKEKKESLEKLNIVEVMHTTHMSVKQGG